LLQQDVLFTAACLLQLVACQTGMIAWWTKNGLRTA